MKKVGIILLLLISMTLVGCLSFNDKLPASSEDEITKPRTEGLVPNEQGDKEQSPEEQQSNQEQDTEEDGQSANGDAEVTMNTIRNQLYIGMSQQKVIQVLGKQYTGVRSAMDNSNLWRYDIGAVEGYVSPDDELDFGDIEGLLADDVSMQVWVEWDTNEKVSGYSAIYVNETDGKVYSYHMFEDGSEKEQAITN